MTFAKGVGNGLALGGVVGRAEIIDAFSANSISTFGGNPLATAGALANLKYLLDNDLQGNALKQGARIRDILAPVVEQTEWIAELRGKGLMLAVETVIPGGTDPDPDRAAALMEGTKERGLLVGKGGLYGNVLRLAPPLSVTDEEAEQAASIIVDTIQDLS
jgi:4-aminobutyrate aminotransferase